MDKVFYVTFGAGGPFRYSVLRVEALDDNEVREAMFRTTKGWCDVLDEARGKDYIARHDPQVIVCPRRARDLDLS